MPLPPVHGLAALLPYFKNKALLDPLALVASATAVDVEPLIYIFLGQPLTHQIWHGWLLTLTIYPVLVALFVFSVERLLEGNVQSAYKTLRFNTDRAKYPPHTIYLCCLLGGASHMLFDMFTHQNLPYVIYPITYGNPFYLGQYTGIIELTSIGLALATVFLWWKNQKHAPESSK